MDPMLIPDECFFKQICLKNSSGHLYVSVSRCIIHLKFSKLEVIGLTRDAIEQHGSFRYKHQRPVDMIRVGKIADDMNEHLEKGEMPEIDIKIATVRQQEPKMIDGQHRFKSLYKLYDAHEFAHSQFEEKGLVIIHVFDYPTDSDRKHAYKVLNNNAPLASVYKSEKKEKIDYAWKRLLGQVHHLYSEYINECPYETEYDQFTSPTFDESDFIEEAHDFARTHRDHPLFDKFIESNLKDSVDKIPDSDIYPYYEALDLDHYPGGCVAITALGKKCKMGCKGVQGFKFPEHDEHGICGMHLGKNGINCTKWIDFSKQYRYTTFKKRFDATVTMKCPKGFIFKLGETENNWLLRAFDEFVKIMHAKNGHEILDFAL